jgi:hypothetical protein
LTVGREGIPVRQAARPPGQESLSRREEMGYRPPPCGVFSFRYCSCRVLPLSRPSIPPNIKQGDALLWKRSRMESSCCAHFPG